MDNVLGELSTFGQTYRVGKLDAKSQFHVVRRLGPMLVVAGISVEMIGRGFKMELDDMVAVAGPVMEFLSRMKDEEVDYCIHTCMRVVERQSGNAWAKVLAPDGKSFMFADLEMPAMIRLVMEVLKVNLGNFLPELSAGLTTPSSLNDGQHQGGGPSA